MKKTFFSIVGGFVSGLILSLIFFDYESSWTSYYNRAGVDQVVKEMDFDFVFNASLLMIGLSIAIFSIWTFRDKKNDEKFLKEHHQSKREEK